jgi:predicted amidohydrolase YtcJ
VTHEYTILTGGVVLPGGDAPSATAIAWAADTILAIGSDAEVRAISRGDSLFVDLRGTCVAGAGGTDLEVGGPADLVVLDRDPRRIAGPDATGPHAIAVIRAGRVVEGRLPPGTAAKADHDP